MGILDHPSSSGSQPGQPRGIARSASNSSSNGSSGPLGIDWRKWFPPVTSRTFLSHYLPASGAISHTLYTVHLFSPNIISSIFPTGDLAVSNTILFNANVGLGFYVYFRRHLHRVNPWERVEFSVLASTLFNFGSLLATVLIKALFPAKTPTWLRSVTATVLSAYLLSRAAQYMGLLDQKSSRGSVSPARSVLSRRQTAQPVAIGNAAAPPSVISTSSELHLEMPSTPQASSLPSTILETPPQSNGVQHQYVPMTPSATEHTSSEFDSEDVVTSSGIDSEGQRQNFRYLHSYALNNLNEGHKKSTILRRTTMNNSGAATGVQKTSSDFQKTSSAIQKTSPQKMCFVTPEPSLQDQELAIYTPPPSRLEVPKKARKSPRSLKAKPKPGPNEVDDLDRYIDFAIDHAPFALVPFAVGCWWTGTVPMWSTIKFIFAA